MEKNKVIEEVKEDGKKALAEEKNKKSMEKNTLILQKE